MFGLDLFSSSPMAKVECELDIDSDVSLDHFQFFDTSSRHFGIAAGNSPAFSIDFWTFEAHSVVVKYSWTDSDSGLRKLLA